MPTNMGVGLVGDGNMGMQLGGYQGGNIVGDGMPITFDQQEVNFDGGDNQVDQQNMQQPNDY